MAAYEQTIEFSFRYPPKWEEKPLDSLETTYCVVFIRKVDAHIGLLVNSM